MKHANTNYNFKSLPLYSNPEIAIFCDFDETYRPVSSIHQNHSGINKLENFLIEKSGGIPFIIGWISGSNLNSLLNKSRNYLSLLPNFISPNLGTELFWNNDGKLKPDLEWDELIKASGYQKSQTTRLAKEIRREGIELEQQDNDYQGKNKACFYYYGYSKNEHSIKIIKSMAKKKGMKAMITKCNPAAGDPENAFDVDFIPNCCGKKEIVAFIQHKFTIPRSKSFAFGDSCNDIDMLHAVSNAYLVGNADLKAQQLFPSVTKASYCHGILEILKKSSVVTTKKEA
ncbi:HAD-IIB family hydrolase [Endozoicomonas atrinae]|uniref:HAD-IIB family hydrolase n=1 Tax=Endozoicomonas atrinae TaxID=1333660 RepID=UPI000826C6A6|nr:HAD-IIB family hydrolase [Endozoicomonas atrinae]